MGKYYYLCTQNVQHALLVWFTTGLCREAQPQQVKFVR